MAIIMNIVAILSDTNTQQFIFFQMTIYCTNVKLKGQKKKAATKNTICTHHSWWWRSNCESRWCHSHGHRWLTRLSLNQYRGSCRWWWQAMTYNRPTSSTSGIKHFYCIDQGCTTCGPWAGPRTYYILPLEQVKSTRNVS